MGFKYRSVVLEELARHGVAPREDTPPELVNDFVNDLYRYEIRALRKQMREGKIRKQDYSQRVSDLRKRYPVLSLPVRYWIDD
jgi:hypothetical protein